MKKQQLKGQRNYFLFLLILFHIACSSPVLQEIEKLIPSLLPMPQILPVETDITDEERISFVYTPNDAVLIYTLDGSEPSKINGITYDGVPFSLVESSVVRSRIFKDGYQESFISERYYRVEPLSKEDTAYLDSLSLKGVELSPVFSKTCYEYTANVAYTTDTIEISADAAYGNVMIEEENTKQKTINLSVGKNLITIKVKNGEKENSYQITIIRQSENPSNNANLNSLTLSSGALSPAFAPSVLHYTTSVSYATTSLDLSFIAQDSKASVEVIKQALLVVGKNTIQVKVTAEDGKTVNIYEIIVTREKMPDEPGKNANLASVSVNGVLLPISEKMSTIVTVNPASVVITLEDSAASATIDGVKGVSKEVTVSNTTTVSIKVTAEDGQTEKNYSVTITYREAVTGRIVLHIDGYTHIWAWNRNGVNGDEFASWPGAAMTDENGDGWMEYTFPDTTEIQLIFSNGGNKTADLSQTEGEWWYKNGTWTSYNPDVDLIPPSVTTTPAAGRLEETTAAITLLIMDADPNAKAYYTMDGSTPVIGKNIYSGPISLTSDTVIKVIAIDTVGNQSPVYSFSFSLGQDVTPPVVSVNPLPGTYETAQSVTLTVTDQKDPSPKIYYTMDGTVPTRQSSLYIHGTVLNVATSTCIRALGVDVAGNEKEYLFHYYIGKVNTTRFDPRQETIYFLLTTRFFDGDRSNSVGDEWCSWTEERVNDSITDDGFTGQEDVTWRGDFKGLVEKMDYIKALGFTTIWITPIVQNRGPLCYHGYHGWDFYKEDARLVSPGYDFKRVIDEAHNRGMKICLDVVLNHSGRFGIKNFAEIKYNRDPATYPIPSGWENFQFDENRYQSGLDQIFPNGWQYDGLASPGRVNGVALPPYSDFTGGVRPFTTNDIANYPNLATDRANGALKYQWPSTESYCLTIDGKTVGEPNSLTYEGYKNSDRRLRGHNTGFPTGSGSYDNFPDAHLDSLHEDCPDLNIENPEVADYLIGAYERFIEMGVDMFRVDTVMHMHKETLNTTYWPRLLAKAEQAKGSRGGADFFIFGEVANFVNNLSDKPPQLRQSNYTWDMTVEGPLSGASNNHLLNGNEYRDPDYSHKAVANSPYHVSVIDIISHNGFCDGVGGAYQRAVGSSSAYNDATYLTWYTDSHDYGPNKGETRWKGDFAAAWSMMFTFRGIPIVYYGSEIRFAEGKPNDWPGGGSNGANMSLEKTGRSYYGPHLEGNVTATGFGEYTASGTVSSTLSSELSQHLMGLNRIRQAVPALQMGQYSTEGHNGGWAGYKRRFTGTNKITGEAIDSYVLVGVGQGTHSWTGVLNGTYVDCVTGNTVTASGGRLSFTISNGGDAGLGVYVLQGLATPAPGKIQQSSPYLK